MSPEKFVSQIHLSVVQQNMEIYKDLLKRGFENQKIGTYLDYLGMRQ